MDHGISDEYNEPHALAIIHRNPPDDESQHRFNQLLQESPSDVVSNLRSLHQRREPHSPNAELCQLASHICFFLESINTDGDPGKRVWRDLVDGGLCELFFDIVLDDDFFLEHTSWTKPIVSAFGCLALLCGASRKLAFAHRFLKRSSQMWSHVWSHRDLALQDDMAIRFSWMVWHFATLYHILNRSVGVETKIPHVALYIWYHLQDNHRVARVALNGLEAITTDLDASKVNAFLHEGVISTFGVDALVRRYLADIEDPQLDLRHVMFCLTPLLCFVEKSDAVRSRFFSTDLFSHITRATQRRLKTTAVSHNDRARLWLMAGAFLRIIIEYSSLSNSPVINMKARAQDVAYVMGYTAQGGVDSIATGISADAQLILLGMYSRLIKSPRLDSDYARVQKQQFRPMWYPGLKALRNAGYRLHNSPQHKDLLAGWLTLGNAFGFKERTERSLYERDAARYCSWSMCAYYTEKSERPLLKCRGCGEARYCDRVCQMNDWKEGWHKQRCKRLGSV